VMKKLTVSFLCKFQRKSDLGKWLLHTRGHTVPLALTWPSLWKAAMWRAPLFRPASLLSRHMNANIECIENGTGRSDPNIGRIRALIMSGQPSHPSY
jgi:hypothetical protein